MQGAAEPAGPQTIAILVVGAKPQERTPRDIPAVKQHASGVSLPGSLNLTISSGFVSMIDDVRSGENCQLIVLEVDPTNELTEDHNQGTWGQARSCK